MVDFRTVVEIFLQLLMKRINMDFLEKVVLNNSSSVIGGCIIALFVENNKVKKF